jgi:hypothetical protein
MKKTLSLLLVSFIAFNCSAQLNNTSWKGTLNIEGGMDVVFNFKNDTVDVVSSESGESLETSRYATTDSVITFQKLYGGSQCDTTLGTYKYVITGNQMTISLISDSCYDRSSAIGTMKLEKAEQVVQ